MLGSEFIGRVINAMNRQTDNDILGILRRVQTSALVRENRVGAVKRGPHLSSGA